MGHYIHAIIASPDVLAMLPHAGVHAIAIPLSQGLAMVPLIEHLLENLPESDMVCPSGSDRFEHLCSAVCAQLSQLSRHGPVAYCETDYHGGSGGQCAVVWDNEEMVMPPTHLIAPPRSRETEANGPINAALRILGVEAKGGEDEFDTVGLSWFRDDLDWIESLQDDE